MKLLARLLASILVLAQPAQAQLFGSNTASSATAVAYPASVGAPASAYFVVKPSGWAGSCLQVQRASDNATQDIGWTAGNICDAAAADTFCSGTTCGVSKWYDTGGSARDFAQATQANQATFTNLNQWNGIRPISIQGVTGSATFQSLQAAATCNRNAFTIYLIYAPRTSYGFNVQAEFADAGFTTAYAQIYNAGTALSTNLGSPISFGLYPRAHVNITVLSSSGTTGQIVSTNEQTATNGGLPTSQAFGGLQIGRSLAGNNYNGLQDQYGLVYWCASHTQQQIADVKAGLVASFNPPITFTSRLVYGGSSLIVSFNSTFNQTAPWQMGFGQSSGWETYAMAVGGQTLTTECTTNLAAMTGLFKASAHRNVVVIDANSNGVANQVSFANTAAAQAWADNDYATVVLPCIQAFQAAGFSVVVPTIIARNGFQLGTGNFLDDARIQENADIVGGAAANNYVVSDRASSTSFDATSDTADKNCYAPDGIHLVNVCYNKMGAFDKAAIGQP